MRRVRRRPSVATGENLVDSTHPQVVALLEQLTPRPRTVVGRPVDPGPCRGDATRVAADPTRRPDLIRLLDSFLDDGNPGAMSPSRLRSALGLAE
ncbi:MAG: hypothetical protein ABI873_06830 [Marmoricola sp.]